MEYWNQYWSASIQAQTQTVHEFMSVRFRPHVRFHWSRYVSQYYSYFHKNIRCRIEISNERKKLRSKSKYFEWEKKTFRKTHVRVHLKSLNNNRATISLYLFIGICKLFSIRKPRRIQMSYSIHGKFENSRTFCVLNSIVSFFFLIEENGEN